jgi:hypothetical protein
VAEQQEQAKIEQELRELTPEQVQQINAYFQLSKYAQNQRLEKLDPVQRLHAIKFLNQFSHDSAEGRKWADSAK